MRRVLGSLQIKVLRAGIAIAVVASAAELIGKSSGRWVLLAVASAVVVIAGWEWLIVDDNDSPRRRALVPQEVPAHIGSLIGRETIVRDISRVLRRRSARPIVVVISGQAGLGKSAIAAQIAERVERPFSDGRLYELMGVRAPHLVMQDMVRALEDPHDPPPSDTSIAWKALSRSRRFLAVLDDAPNAEAVHRLLPRRGRCAFLVTSAEPLPALQPALEVELPPLSVEETLGLLGRLGLAERIEAEPDAAKRIAQITRGLPLAAYLTGGLIAMRPQWTLSAILQRVDLLPPVPDPDQSTLDICYALMGEQQRVALCLLTLAPLEFYPWQLAALLGNEDYEEGDASLIIERLSHLGLVERASGEVAGAPVYRLFEHVRNYTQVRAATDLADGTRDAALNRLNLAISERRTEDIDEALRTQVFANLQQGQLQEAVNGAREVLTLARSQAQSTATSEADPEKVKRDQGLALAALSEVQAELGSIAESGVLAAMAARDFNAPDVRPRALRCLGTVQLMLAEYAQAREILHEALMCTPDADWPEKVRILRRLAVAEAQDGQTSGAHETLRTAYGLCDEAVRSDAEAPQAAGVDGAGSDRPTTPAEMAARLRVGVRWADAVLHTLERRYHDAHRLLEQAEDTAAITRSQLWSGWIHWQQAQVLLAEDDYVLARRFALDGADAFTLMAHRYGAAHCRMVAGQALLNMDRPGEAIDLLEEASLTFSACGDVTASARSAVVLAEAQTATGGGQVSRDSRRLALREVDQAGGWAARTELRSLTRLLLDRRRLLSWGDRDADTVPTGIRSAVGPGQ